MPKAERLADRLALERARLFVGRERELEGLNTLLDEELPYRLAHLVGPGGIGKTAVLREWLRRAERQGYRPGVVDGRQVPPEPEALTRSLRRAAGLSQAGPWPGRLGERRILAIDTFEQLAPLEQWLCTELLPTLPVDTVLVLAGRVRLGARWFDESGWGPLLRVLPLATFDEEETRAYLARRHVAPSRHETFYRLTRGHPLALALASELAGPETDRLAESPDVVELLLEKFLEGVGHESQRQALLISASVLWTTEDLLSCWFEPGEARALFDWLRRLSFLEPTPQGLLPHDLVREILVAGARRRAPGWFTSVLERSRTYYMSRLTRPGSGGEDAAARGLLFTASREAVWREHTEAASTLSASVARPGRPEDWAEIEEIALAHEGPQSVELLRYWRTRGAEVIVVPSRTGGVAEFAVAVPLERVTPEEAAVDPGVAPIHNVVRAAGLREDQGAPYFRFWMLREGYQPVDIFLSVFAAITDCVVRTPNLAFGLSAHSEPEAWMPLTQFGDQQRFAEADFSFAGRDFGVFGHDFRDDPPGAWLRRHMDRFTGRTAAAPQPPATRLARDAFERAVRKALDTIDQLDRLAQNPLLETRLVVERAAPGADLHRRAEALVEILSEHGARTFASERDRQLYEVLDRTFLHPAEKQRAAAYELGIPYGTYRRYLRKALARFTESLYQRESELWRHGG